MKIKSKSSFLSVLSVSLKSSNLQRDSDLSQVMWLESPTTAR